MGIFPLARGETECPRRPCPCEKSNDLPRDIESSDTKRGSALLVGWGAYDVLSLMLGEVASMTIGALTLGIRRPVRFHYVSSCWGATGCLDRMKGGRQVKNDVWSVLNTSCVFTVRDWGTSAT
jgi:hypothetical protein